MKRLIAICALLMGAMFLAPASQARTDLLIPTLQTQFQNPNISYAKACCVLKACAKQEQMPYGQLKKKFDEGDITIVDLGNGTYEVTIQLDGGGIAIVVVGSDL